MTRKLKSIFQSNKHRMLALMLTFCMLVSTMPAMGFTALAVGESDLTINTVDDLKQFRDQVNSGADFEGKTVVLAKNIDLGQINNWNPIGTFKGTFDGQKHIIYNLTINTSTRYTGLFSKLENATVKNLGLEDVNIDSSERDVGCLAGNAQGGSIESCYVTGSVKGSAGVGGILGSTYDRYHPTTIKNCYARVSLSHTNTTKDTAGISGWNEATSVKIENCFSACIGEVRPIAGWSDGSTVLNDQFKNTYFDITLSPGDRFDGGRVDLGKTSAELKQKNTFIGWDFTSVWSIDPNKNGGYPYLNGFTPGLGGAPSSASVTVIDQNENPVTDAKVELKKDTTVIELSNQGNGIYSTMLDPDATNPTYKIYVNNEETASTLTQNGSNAVSVTVQITVVASNFTMTFNGVTTDYETLTMAWNAAQSAAATEDNRAVVKMYQDHQCNSTQYFTIQNGDYITLDLNGHTVDRNRTTASNSGRAFLVEGGGSFILEDSSSDVVTEQGKITKGYLNDLGGGGGAVHVKKDGTFTLNGGSLCENKGNNRGGAVYNEGTFIMNGGSITRNTTNGNGGGVSNFGTFVMNGGEITENTVPIEDGAGGGVHNYGNTFSISSPGSFTMNGGKISKNTARWGGGIQNSGELVVNGQVVENTAWYGGGIHSEDKGDVPSSVLIQAAAKIVDNQALTGDGYGSGGGIYFQDGTLTIEGGIIARNTSIWGGGVYAQSTEDYLTAGKTASVSISGGKISGNSAGYYGGGLDIWDANLTMTGGEISENSASWGGGVHLGGGDFKLHGGKIVKNTASTVWGGGVYFEDGAVSFQNNMVISENMYQESANNFFFGEDMTSQIGTMGDNANIGVITEIDPTAGTPVVLSTNAIVTKDSLSKFSSDNEAYCLQLNEGTAKLHLHSCDQNIVDEEYLSTPADCTHDAVYFKSCSCGVKGTETFEAVGTKLGHSFTDYVYNQDATFDADGTETAHCDREGCSETDNRTATGTKLIDTNAPTGEIVVKENKWSSFINTITFGIFCKDKYDVTITAEDKETGVKNIEYLLSDAEISAEDIKDKTDWTEYAAFSIEIEGKYIIYAKITDKSGNVTYISSDGLVIDKTAPAIQGITNGEIYCSAVDVTVSDEYLDGVTITLNGKEITLVNGKFTVSPAAGEQTIVVTDKAGNFATCKVTVNDGHTLSYIASSNVITEKCAHCDHSETAVITATEADYNGSEVKTAKVSYSANWLGGELPINYQNNNHAGLAIASIEKDNQTARVEFRINAGSQSAPTGISSTNETIAGKADGKLTGVNSTMEYCKAGETTYTAISGNTVENLAAGTYYVRYKANTNYNASSDSAAITIAAGRKLVVTLTSGMGYKLEAVGLTQVSYGESFTFKLTFAAEYGETNTFSVKANGTSITKQNSEYTITVTDDTTITVEGVKDITKPELVSVSYNDNPFKEFLNTITFGLLFDDTVTVTLTASDAGSGVKEFKYRLGNGEEKAIDAVNGSATFSITSDFIGNINGVKAVDNDGNESEAKAYEYFAIDKSNPTKPTVTTSYTSGEWTTNDVTFTVSGSTATSGIVKYQYSMDNGQTWTDMEATATTDATAENPVNVTEATLTVSESTNDVSYVFRAVSGVAKESNVSAATVVKIDKELPTIGASGDTNTIAQSSVVTITTDGGISGAAKVEVSKDNGEWTEVTDATYTVTANGTYTFRVTNGAGATATQSITYEKLDTQKPVLTIDSGNYTEGTWSQGNVTLSVSNTTENLGTTRFEYKVGNGQWTAYTAPVVISEDTTGITYTFRATSQAGITSDEVSITVKKDGTNPDGNIAIQGNSVKRFINAITFGLFFNEDVDVTITAEDAISGIASIQYFRSESILTEDEVKALTDWTDYTSISEAAADAGKFIYYVKLTDNAGNITCYGSDGVTFDTTTPEISGITDGETYYTTQIAAAEDDNLETLTLNGEAVTSPITLDGDKEATYTIVATDKAGNETTVVISMKPIALISETIDDLTGDNVKSTDKDAIEAVKEAAETVDTENATQDEKDALQEILDQCDELLNQIEETQKALEECKEKAEAVDPDKATSDDKDVVKDLIDEINKLDGSDNLTDSEKAEQQKIKDQLEDVLEELDKISGIIDEAGKGADGINKDNVKPEDKSKLEEAKKELENVLKDYGDHLTAAEKDTVQSKLDTINALLAQLDKTTSPETGDNSNMWLWIALLFVSCGGVITTSVYGKKKQREE